MSTSRASANSRRLCRVGWLSLLHIRVMVFGVTPTISAKTL